MNAETQTGLDEEKRGGERKQEEKMMRKEEMKVKLRGKEIRIREEVRENKHRRGVIRGEKRT